MPPCTAPAPRTTSLRPTANPTTSPPGRRAKGSPSPDLDRPGADPRAHGAGRVRDGDDALRLVRGGLEGRGRRSARVRDAAVGRRPGRLLAPLRRKPLPRVRGHLHQAPPRSGSAPSGTAASQRRRPPVSRSGRATHPSPTAAGPLDPLRPVAVPFGPLRPVPGPPGDRQRAETPILRAVTLRYSAAGGPSSSSSSGPS